MTGNKLLKFEEDNSYKENLDREFERLTNGEITKEEFLEKHINRCTVRKSMPLEEYKNLPLYNDQGKLLEDAQLEKSGIKFISATLGPFRMNDKIPNRREDNTGLGIIMTGKLGRNLEDVPEVILKMDMIDVIF